MELIINDKFSKDSANCKRSSEFIILHFAKSITCSWGHIRVPVSNPDLESWMMKNYVIGTKSASKISTVTFWIVRQSWVMDPPDGAEIGVLSWVTLALASCDKCVSQGREKHYYRSNNVLLVLVVDKCSRNAQHLRSHHSYITKIECTVDWPIFSVSHGQVDPYQSWPLHHQTSQPLHLL